MKKYKKIGIFMPLLLVIMGMTGCDGKESEPTVCNFENPLTDLAWFAEIYANLSESNNSNTYIYQVNYSGGIGFFVDYGMALDACGYLYDCEGNELCRAGCWQPSTCDELNVDWENTVLLWRGGDFCNVATYQSIAQTGYFVNQFFKQQAETVHPANELWDNVRKIQKFVDWLNEFDCIVSAEIVCVSCIETLPEQSEVAITYLQLWQSQNVVMDILMTDIPQFAGIHSAN